MNENKKFGYKSVSGAQTNCMTKKKKSPAWELLAAGAAGAVSGYPLGYAVAMLKTGVTSDMERYARYSTKCYAEDIQNRKNQYAASQNSMLGVFDEVHRKLLEELQSLRV